MSRRSIFLIECSAPHWVDVVRLLEQSGVTVTKWTAWTHAKGNIPASIFHDTIDAKRGLDQYGRKPTSLEFDEACEKVWREDAQTIYDMMNKFDPNRDQSFLERSALFVDHLCLWRDELSRARPDLVVFPAPPHVVYDYILLALCRALSIPTLMFEEITILPPYSLAMPDYRIGPKITLGHYPISDETKTIVARLRGDYAMAKPAREVAAEREKRETMKNNREAIAKLVNETKIADQKHRGKYGDNQKLINITSLVKERNVPLRNSFSGDFANTRYIDQLAANIEDVEHLRGIYESLQTSELPRNFIYVPLAGQPERTSNPQADIHANQLLMIRHIAAGKPKDWGIVVKEHPNQFSPHFAGGTCRDAEYYPAIAAMGATIVSTSTDPFTLIDRAGVVATTGGTVALEATARGKRSMLFGDAWYRDCPGVTRVRTQADVRTFFSGIIGKPDIIPGDHTDLADDGKRSTSMIGAAEHVRGPTSEQFEDYIESLRHFGFEGIADYPPQDYPMDPQKNVENLTREVLKRIQSNPSIEEKKTSS
ncbi:hypothetical protein ML401_23155 [Bradyrhizobium sp. 62B]|uniref:capsular polysaccharide export protein, LipB/KpsS family n=1 Tax=Bradyrhizobium sp. 62B TaxID=2898442 RepID=UPI002557FAE8|nr:hypothetical protein ML401_23155 [Bradyrhizobium sp. 62B]